LPEEEARAGQRKDKAGKEEPLNDSKLMQYAKGTAVAVS